jgi:virulence factor Mce-like protein
MTTLEQLPPLDLEQFEGLRLEPSRRRLAAFGIGFIALVVAIIAVIVQSISGNFTNFVAVNAELPSTGNAIQIDSPVQYRDVTVGSVASQGRPVGGGVVSAVLHLKPSRLAAIPRSVRATVGPISVFGNQAIQLVAPASEAGPHLAPGQTIPALASGPTASLQATLGDLDNLLNSLHPAEMNAALTALATALSGQGRSLGETFVRSSLYIHQMLPLIPTIESNFRLLDPVTDQLASATPDVLGIFANLTVTNQTYTADQSQLHQSLVGGAMAAGQSSQLLSAIQDPWVRLLAASGPLFQDITQNANEIAQILSGLDIWAKAWSASESHGPFLTLTSSLAVSNPADVVRAALGDPNADTLFAQGIGTNLVNPPTYTAANCPITYGPVPGPCLPASAGGASSLIAAASQQAAVSTIAAGLNHGSRPPSPAVASLLLSPVLQSMVSGQ